MSQIYNVLERTKGIIAPLPTWLDETGRVDLDAMGQHADHLIINGCKSGIFILGTTGEFPYVTWTDKIKIIKFMADHLDGKVPLLVGVSACGVKEATGLSKIALEVSADAVVAIVPQYFPLAIRDVERYYRKLSAAISGKIPLILYHMPLIEKQKITPELVFKLAQDKVISGIKATVLDVEFIAEIRKLLDMDYTIQCNLWTGTDFATVECLKRDISISGAIIGSINLFPGYYSALFKAFSEKPRNTSRCDALIKMNGLISKLFQIELREVPSMIKEALNIAGLPFASSTAVSSPLPSVSDLNKAKTIEILNELKERGIEP